ncbi:LysR family transcriptional regulator [Mycobacterium sp. OTB74]|uniref:LysR family transcriptional regulator n=1 Tax=Mycobacterium sp. OTB74 TaxID=1853452 RepID=UPI0024755E3B|nr:LysR family transcriptional regulator [Mycobacterium sp. OTB74]MDH6247345.1 LysR family transcriptional activator of glutamate synthase operon [Mycobacterium sp. OTB74]
MHLDELQWFVVLAETEHVTEAAAELGITQPTLSRALLRLEKHVGTTLFDRVGRRLRLNACGQVLLEHARRAMAEFDVAQSRIDALLDPDRGLVRLAFLHSMANWFVPDALRRFRSDAPAVRFELFQGAAHDIAERLYSGQADLAITSPRPTRIPCSWRVLYVERLCLAVPAEHRLAERARVRLNEAADEPFITLLPDFGLRQLTDQVWAESGIAPEIAFEAMEIPAMEGLVAAGFGVAVMPLPRPGRGDPSMRYLPLANSKVKREVGMAWVDGRALVPAAERFAQFVTAE